MLYVSVFSIANSSISFSSGEISGNLSNTGFSNTTWQVEQQHSPLQAAIIKFMEIPTISISLSLQTWRIVLFTGTFISEIFSSASITFSDTNFTKIWFKRVYH